MQKKKIILLVTVLFFPVLLLAKTTVVYHTSDTHGFFFPRNGQGGFAALAAVLKNGPQPYLLLDSGDFANGTVETRNSKGLKAVQIMNKLGYDATTLGNHEFDFKANSFPAIVAALNFPMLAANFFEENTQNHPPHILPYLITEKNGVKFAVIGLGNRTPTKPATGYRFEDPLVSLEKVLIQVEAQQPQVVIVIVHDALEDSKHGTQPYVAQIAQRFAGRVHVVLGGHAHHIVQNRYIGEVLFVESGSQLQHVSQISIETDDQTGEFLYASSQLIPLIVQQTGEDADVKKFVESLREPGVDEVLGTTTDVLTKQTLSDDQLDSPLSNWVADLVKDYAHTSLAILNNGVTRMDVSHGPITLRELIDVVPYDNTVTRVTVSGEFLAKFIQDGLSGNSLFTYAGIQVFYRKDAAGVITVQDIRVNGEPLDPQKQYLIATSTYISDGNNEGHLFKQIPDTDKQLVGKDTIRDLMAQALRQGPVTPPATGRIQEIK